MKRLISLLFISVLAIGGFGCDRLETDDDNDLLDGILADPDGDDVDMDDLEVIEEEVPYVEPPTELPDVDLEADEGADE
jgi:hypothetical protein